MTYSPQSSLESALPENVTFSDDLAEFIEQWMALYRKMAAKINDKERAFYPEAYEILNNQQFFTIGDSKNYRSVFRKVFSFGAIAAGGTLNIAHNIANFSIFTRIYGTCITNVVDYRPLPYVSITAVNQGTQVNVTAANIVITNGAAAAPITSGIMVIEYLKN